MRRFHAHVGHLGKMPPGPRLDTAEHIGRSATPIEWLAFFLEGTEITARSAAEAAKQILTLFAKDRDRIQTIGRAASSALRVHEYLQKKPLVGIGVVAEELKLSIPTVTVALDHLVRLGIVKEVTGKRRARVFGYSRYLKILSEGTEPLKR
jgi:Fic family protein